MSSINEAGQIRLAEILEKGTKESQEQAATLATGFLLGYEAALSKRGA